ncbi:hypothetical protein [Agrobacterium tumefaciens]|uniref:hypothetical protein n=1 Tax=Agrobacterium tumefaciens TaxID=358 RepID=UPI001574666B
MSELKYLPSAWLDECIPEPQENPDSFICRAEKAWFLRPPEDADDAENYVQRLHPGDIILFDEHRYFGNFTLTIDARGGKRAAVQNSPSPTKLSRGQKRYQVWLEYDGSMSFIDYLKWKSRQRQQIGGAV